MNLDSKGILGWKRFYFLLSLSLLIYFLSIFLFSNKFLLQEIIFSTDYPINEDIKQDFMGKSIHLLSTDQIIDKYLTDENIERVTVNKAYPDSLEVNIEQYQTLALIVDYRTDSPMYYKLYKNGKVARALPEEIPVLSLNDNSIKIINGPLNDHVYGEFVNYFLLLQNTDNSIETSFSLDSDNLTGEIGDYSINFITPENLGKKASAVYQRLQEPCPSFTFTVDMDPLSDNVIVVCNT